LQILSSSIRCVISEVRFEINPLNNGFVRPWAGDRDDHFEKIFCGCGDAVRYIPTLFTAAVWYAVLQHYHKEIKVVNIGLQILRILAQLARILNLR
jgi:hypothetical protein